MFRSIFGLALLAIPFAANAANLVVNGDFEANTVVSSTWDNYYVGSTGLTGWDVVGASGDNVSLTAAGYLGQPTQQLDVSGDTDHAGSGIEQVLSTVAGQSYTLTFDAYTGGTQYTGLYLAQIDGATVLSGITGDESSFTGGIVSYSYSFVASGATTKVGFINIDPYVSQVDNVSVEAVPEPMTMAVLGLGAAAMLRRRNRKA